MSSDIIQCLISPAVFFYGSEEMRKIILAPILWMQIQLTDLVYPNRVHNIAPQVCRSREGVRGTPWAPRNGLQVSEFADEYLNDLALPPIL